MKWYAIFVCGKTYWVRQDTPGHALQEARANWMNAGELLADYAVYEAVHKFSGIGSICNHPGVFRGETCPCGEYIE